MGNQQRWLALGWVGLAALAIRPAEASDLLSIPSDQATSSKDRAALSLSNATMPGQELEQGATTVAEWLAQASETAVQITDIQLESVGDRLEIRLRTTTSLTEVTPSQVGNAWIADIPNATLNLSTSGFQASDPVPGIALISVTQLPNDRVRIAITGTDAVPVIEIDPTGEGAGSVGWRLSITPGTDGIASEDAIQVVVTGEQGTNYNPGTASTATRTDTPVDEIPASIQVIPQQVLDDQQIVDLRNALENVGGVTLDGDYGGTGAGSLILRGFTQDTLFRDGFRVSNFYSVPEIANIEQIEVLRGPASVLFGQVQPGGVVNVITKQPLDSPYYGLDFTAGQFSLYRPSIDLSGPLTTDGSLLYRLNAVYENSGSFRDEVSTERIFVAPVVQWKIDDRTSLTFDFEYLYDDPVFDRGVTALSDGSLVLPINRFLGYPQLDDFTTEAFRGGYRFEHEFNDHLRLRNALAINSVRQGGARSDLNGGLIDDQFIPRELRDDISLDENYGIQTELVASFTTGTIEHELLFGVDFNRLTNYYNSEAADLPPIDIFAPNYDIRIPDQLSPRYGQVVRNSLLGVYLQDQIQLLDRLHLLIGGRFDWTEQDQVIILDGTSSSQSDSAFSPRLGIVYQPIDPLSLYASFSQSFFPVIGLSAEGSTFDPERGTQYEVGVKAEITEQLSATLAAYHLTRRNVLTTDPDDPDFSIQVGEQRSQGAELSVTGEILPGWNVFASYAYTDAEITEDNDLPIGSPLANVAEHTASLWTTYEIQSNELQGLGFGLGLFFVGDRPGYAGSDPDNFELPSYLRADAALYYRRDNWQAQIKVNNLFDVEYYTTHQGADIVYPGAPLNVTASVSYQF
ncbi:MAG: TonB-dependent siderophore receptor [Elainella sp. Prado103]|jgi:iron complex outermembrane receptor protein|nr:TonB-dependent siderophore receptor [Elainella sp. Prado103]